MEINPVFRRESRVRWRGDRAYVLLLLLATAMCGIVLWAYYEAGLAGRRLEDSGSGGRDVFVALSYLQLGAWLLIVPALAAPGIAFERERGLLEGLQLAGLSGRRVAFGKFAAVLMFALQLLLVSAPPLAICFLLGGVATSEFVQALALQIATIFLGAALGLYFSSRARRPQQAIRNTFIALVLWLIGLFFALFLLEEIGAFLMGQRGTWRWTEGLLLLHPAFQMTGVFEPAEIIGILSRSGAASWFVSPLQIFLALEIGAALLLLRGAALHAGRTLPEAQWMERRRILTLRRGRLQTAEAAPPGARRAPAWEVPLVSLLRFRNPVLQREVHGLFRLRRFSRGATLLLYLTAALLLVAYIGLLLVTWWEPETRADIWTALTWVAVVAVMLCAPLRGANAIARERENGTWESLRLSLLTPREIVFGKASAMLVFLAVIALSIAPIWVPCVKWTEWSDSHNGRVVPLLPALGMGAMLFGVAFSFTAFGMWISWRCRSLTAANGWTIGPLFVWLFSMNVFVRSIFYWASEIYSAFYEWTGGGASRNPLASVYYSGYSQTAPGSLPLGLRFLYDCLVFCNPWKEVDYLTNWMNISPYFDPFYNNWPGLIPIEYHALTAAGAQFFIGWLLLCDVARRMKKTATLEGEAGRQ